MSNFTPKRGPNISQYLADLNSVQAPQESSLEDPYALENDLGLFTSVEFSDPFDLDDSTDPADVNFGQSASGKEDVAGCKDGGDSDVKNMNFGDGFQFNDMPFASNAAQHNGLPALQNIGQQSQGFDVTYASPASFSPVISQSPQIGDKRTFGQTTPDSLEASSRAAAEEDKRRRNTAASARFRVKKKQREQALEKSAKEMSDRVETLEGRISELERENKWLKSLVVDKSAGSKEEVAQMLQKFSEETRSTSAAKKGVGTIEIEGEVA